MKECLAGKKPLGIATNAKIERANLDNVFQSFDFKAFRLYRIPLKADSLNSTGGTSD